MCLDSKRTVFREISVRESNKSYLTVWTVLGRDEKHVGFSELLMLERIYFLCVCNGMCISAYIIT